MSDKQEMVTLGVAYGVVTVPREIVIRYLRLGDKHDEIKIKDLIKSVSCLTEAQQETAYIELEVDTDYDGYCNASVTLRWEEYETDQEIRDRLNQEWLEKQEREKRDRKTYERLKARFEQG